jgi:hypothetical protein
MDEPRLIAALSSYVGQALARELVIDFAKLRQDFATKTLERASPGKFVETFVQCLQQIATGSHELKVDVDEYLRNKVEHETTLPDGLRICATRVARSIYTLLNKRNIAHKNSIDPNTFDLALAHQSAAWIMAELLRNASGITMHEAGVLVELVQCPVGTLVEEIEGTRLVHADVSLKGEILILLHSRHPERVAVSKILESMVARNSGSVRNKLRELRTEKLLYGEPRSGYRLTQAGHIAAVDEIRRLNGAWDLSVTSGQSSRWLTRRRRRYSNSPTRSRASTAMA